MQEFYNTMQHNSDEIAWSLSSISQNFFLIRFYKSLKADQSESSKT